MLAPLSWLKEYVDITLEPKKLGDLLTEIGLGCEKIIKKGTDTIFEFEITPNRPDLLSIVGIAREIAAIEGKKIKFPGAIVNHPRGGIGKAKKTLPITIKTDPKINPRFTGIIIADVKVRESPEWLKERLKSVNQRSINNIVDITNYVMLELGNPIHAFDYDKIGGHIMRVHQTKGGEQFESVDGINYHLPKDAVVISDKEKIIDLCGMKGGRNCGTYKETKNIFIRVPVEIPNLIRRTSLSLGLRSEASSIFERGVNKGGTVDALKRCVDLILKIAGGEIASELYDIKKLDFKSWKLDLRIEKLNQILGINIPEKKVTDILESLNLSPRHLPGEQKRHLEGARIECAIPTYRNDLKIEEDLIEEVARIYGYNNFPKTLPIGEIPILQIPYFKDYRLEEKVKNILKACGFSEVYTYSLVSEKDLLEFDFDPQNSLRVDNPVSLEFEYLRPSLSINLTKALRQNLPNFNEINLFELGKIYKGKSLDTALEAYELAGVSNKKSYYEIKGILERLCEELSIETKTFIIEPLSSAFYFSLPFSEILNAKPKTKVFKALAKYPPIVEDLSIVAGENIKTADIISEIKKQSPLISEVSLLDKFENSRTFHIVYQDKNKNLTTEETSQIREKILKNLKEKFHAAIKE